MDRKKEIRAKILKMRQALPKEEVREKSLRIMRRIEETETFKNVEIMSAVILYPPKQKSSGKNPIFMLRWLHKQRTGEAFLLRRNRSGLEWTIGKL